ncbi:hypothetical protein SAMN05428936_102176 [Pelagibacterium halotolerans]|uniref:Large exoproteins involved in heme utilization or adhesion n=1 Tax=Pelagibacterium halotolerans (strain DSM 22347 / JCM 15775 / CGMCC 1.7692 / B2) TaxID=1082931 RepID=G4RAK6_PELHB|nr:hypothetical protein KKY_1539 [Pelagibacterium halotolerans B2]SEA16818.1 hypothetical protein SAMN05428936_102176 [Pelagibacterium halotolerans]
MALKVVGLLCIGLLVVFALLYVRLLFGPISLGFLSDRAKSEVAGIVDENFDVDWRDFGLSLTGPVSVGFHLSNVVLTERASDAVIEADALEIGLSPLGLLIGRPDARIILIEPRFQMVQDLLGPRLSRFEFLQEEGTGETVVRVIEGEQSAPDVQIGDAGISSGDRGAGELGLRSDNDWLVANVEALNEALAQLSGQAMAGQVRRFEIRDGSVGVLDTVYGLYRSFENVDLDVRAGRIDGRVTAGFAARIAGETLEGEIVRESAPQGSTIEADIRNLDFSTVIPFLDDANSLAALRGTGDLVLSVALEAGSGGRVKSGNFVIDIGGTRLRLNNDLFDLAAEPFAVDWFPAQSRFSIPDVEIGVGQSRGIIGGDIVMGFDEQFGPTLGMSIRGRDLWLHPDDMGAPSEPFETVHYEGWSAPLYGAVGIDRMVVAKEGVSVVMQGRLDMVREGVGLDVSLSGRGASADDIKRLWPYLFATEGREWFTEYVADGAVSRADMRFRFPVGTIALDGEPRPMPEGAMQIDLVGDGVQLRPLEGVPAFQVDGEARLTMRDNQLTMAFERANLTEFGDEVSISNAAYINQDVSASEQVFEISGDVSGPVPAILDVVTSDTLNLLEDFDFGIDPGALAQDLTGSVAGTVIATIETDDTGQLMGTDYALNGSISDMASARPIQGVNFSDADLTFTASQAGFRVVGAASVGEARVDLEAEQSGDGAPQLAFASTLSVADAAELGIDLSPYMGGTVRVVARPRDDGAIEVQADLTDASLAISDIGISKAQGVAGGFEAIVSLGGADIAVSDIALNFGTVRLEGELGLGADGTLVSADFSTFQISADDNAQVSMTPVEGGYALAISGAQLDLKPVLKRFFNLEGDQAAGASESLEDQVFDVSVNLDRALGYFGTVAFNVDLDLSVMGEQLREVNLATQFGGGRSASATTNPLPNGRVISYATNDLGETLRFIGVYPRLVNGEGSMVMRYDENSETDTGEFVVRNFAIVDEENLDAIVGAHAESQEVLAGASAMEFDYGRAEFVRFNDRIELVEAAIYGDSVGGTVRGNIMTDAGQYDLAGTYVPLFGLNNFFQQIPLLGPIFGGREGEGLLGVTFAVRGPLDQPDLLINPVSILAPGVFRTLFEYRSANQPQN